MDLKSQVKNVLRMCGHAFVSTIHDRLNGIEGMLQQLLVQNTHLADTQTALLQSQLHVVEKMAPVQEVQEQNTQIASTQTAPWQSSAHLVGALLQLQSRIEEAETRVAAQVREYCATRADAQALAAALAEARDELGAGKAVLEVLQRQIQDFSQGWQAASASLAVLEPVARHTDEFLTNQSIRQVCVGTSDYLFTNPELGLLAFLYSYLPSRTVLDVGAHAGDVSEQLLASGYEVYAFEPYPESYRRLTERLGGRSGFHAFNLGLGSVTGELPLYTVHDFSTDKRYEDATVFHSLARHGMPADLSFGGAVPVTVRRLSELHREGIIPANPSLVKIDTEGYDLEVIRGMEDQRYPVVMVEFWDGSIPFATQGLLYTVESMVREMRQRGYMWYIVIYRVWGHNETAFFCNHDRPVPESWGNVVFFQDREVFAQAQHWCSAALPRTYFKHVAASPENLSKEPLDAAKM